MPFFPEEPLPLTTHDGFGYFPVYPGLKLNNNRYQIVRKLGYGPRSSVWLIVDSKFHDSYFALKVFTTYETGLQKSSKPNELDFLTLASPRGCSVDLYNSFMESSHHGEHLCLVLDLTGLSFEHLRLSSPTKSLQRHIVQRAVAGVLEELEKMHDCGIIHGAVTASNFVFEIDPDPNGIDDDFESAEIPPCTIEDKVTVSDVEYPIVRSHPVPNGIKWNASWDDINRWLVILINLGHAQPKKATPTWEKSRMDKSLRPPEVILGLPYSSKVDIWMLGCTVYQMLTGRPLVPDEMATNDETMLGWLIAMSGWNKDDHTTPAAALNTKYFDEKGAFKLEISDETLESQIGKSGVVPADDIPGIVKFIQACLTLDPATRPSPDDLFRGEWVQSGVGG